MRPVDTSGVVQWILLFLTSGSLQFTTRSRLLLPLLGLACY
jgi:hypothetical protein